MEDSRLLSHIPWSSIESFFLPSVLFASKAWVEAEHSKQGEREISRSPCLLCSASTHALEAKRTLGRKKLSIEERTLYKS